MLTLNELRKIAHVSGARDISKVEIDVILTNILQLFHEKGVCEHIAFKGGTMLRKMVFGPRGRLSTDLDFTLREGSDRDDVSLMMAEALDAEYQGLQFAIARDKDWYDTDDGFAINPVVSHEGNREGIKIKIEVSCRETPILAVKPVAQIGQPYFDLLPFKPADIPSLQFEEAVAEKLRAASQRSKVRDLHDLSEIAKRDFDKERVRKLAVLKLWSSGGEGMSYERLKSRIETEKQFDETDLKSLLRKDETPKIDDLKRRVVDGFAFLQNLNEEEQALANDSARARAKEEAALRASLRGK